MLRQQRQTLLRLLRRLQLLLHLRQRILAQLFGAQRALGADGGSLFAPRAFARSMEVGLLQASVSPLRHVVVPRSKPVQAATAV